MVYVKRQQVQEDLLDRQGAGLREQLARAARVAPGREKRISVSGRVRFSGIGLCLVAAHTWHGPESAEQDLQQSNQTDNPLHKDSSWEERHSEEHGRKYWVNMSTRETTWHKPESAQQQLQQSNQTDNPLRKDSS